MNDCFEQARSLGQALKEKYLDQKEKEYYVNQIILLIQATAYGEFPESREESLDGLHCEGCGGCCKNKEL